MLQISAAQFFEDLRENLSLELVGGKKGLSRMIRHTRYQKNGLALVGFLEPVHPDRVQIWGNTEMNFLLSLDESAQIEAVTQFFSLPICLVIVSAGHVLSRGVKEAADRANVPLIRSQLSGKELLPHVISYLEFRLAAHERLHGVLVDLYGVGVLIQGKSGIGKSECALHLVTRGHRLVADDIVDIHLREQELVGQSTDLLKHHLEVRGLGILNIKDLFGVVSIRYEKNVEMVVELVPWTPDQAFDRLGIDLESKKILERSIPLVRIPVAPGRNIPTLIEVAARNRLLQRMGYFSAHEFSRSLTEQIAMSSVPPSSEDEALRTQN